MTPKGEVYVIEVNPLPGPDAGLLRSVLDRQGGRHRLPHADRRDPGRRPQAAAREAPRGADGESSARRGQRRAARPRHAPAGRQRQWQRRRRDGNGGAAAANGAAPPPAPRAAVHGRDSGAAAGRPARYPRWNESPTARPRLRARALPDRARYNAITDVAGVRVGHTTLIEGEGTLEVGKGPVRTGVTAILPHDDVFTSGVHRRQLRAQRRGRGVGADPGRRVGPAGDADPAHQHAGGRQGVRRRGQVDDQAASPASAPTTTSSSRWSASATTRG